jgi:acyl carrier protein
MTAQKIRATALEVLADIAPDVDLTSLDPAVSLQEQLDLDSLDFFNFVVALHERLGVDIPERDYGELATLDGCVRYLSEAEAVGSAAAGSADTGSVLS